MTQVVIRRPTWAEIFTVSVTLTDAEIKALPTTDIEIVAAPGAGKMIVPLIAVFVGSFEEAYTNIDGDNSRLRLRGNEVFMEDIDENLGGAFLGFGDPDLANPICKVITAILSEVNFLQQFEDRALELTSTNPADYTGGHVDNTLKVTVLYTIIDV